MSTNTPEIADNTPFYYYIRLTNTVGTVDNIVLTDKLPPNAIVIESDVKLYDGCSGNAYNPPGLTVTLTGDLLDIDFGPNQLPAISAIIIEIPVTTAAGTAPDTLYNSVLVQSRDDPNKSNDYAVVSIYLDVPYDQRFATESFEDLLKAQTELLSSFEALTKTNFAQLDSTHLTTAERVEFVSSF